jgi:hypothetical protein
MDGNSAVASAAPSLEVLLSREPIVPGALCRLPLPPDCDIRERIADALREAGVIDEPLPFESFHQRVRPECVLPLQELAGAPSVQATPSIQRAYQRLVKMVARELLRFDVVFEANPFLRFHVPATMPLRYRSAAGLLLAHHNDILVGDPFEQINCWLPLTRCWGTGAFHISTLEESQPLLRRFAAADGLDAASFIGSRPRFYEMLATDKAFQDAVVGICKPLEIDYGELLVFDPRVLHATTENFEDYTRISIDFRLVPLPAYEERARRWQASGAAATANGPAPLRGGFYDERTAFEL